MKNSDQDLRDKHALAFRPPPEAVPQPADDARVADGLDAALHNQGPPPAPRPDVLPLLDADGRPLPEDRIVPMLAPLMMVPPTPRSSPGTPRQPHTPRATQQSSMSGTARRTRSRSKTPIPSRHRLEPLPTLPEGEAAAKATSEPPALPSEPSAPPPGQTMSGPLASSSATSEPRALPSEPSAPPLGHMEHAAGAERQTSGQPMSQSTMPRGSLDSGATASLQRHLEQAMDDRDSVSRGVKRTASQSPAPGGHSQDLDEPNAATALLSFCQDCGEQHRIILDDGLSHCVRCSSTTTVTNPSQVRSWFDEVLEQEAVDQYFVEKTTGSPAPPSTSFLSRDHFGATCSTRATSTRSLERLRVLRRHGREMAGRTGWDGSPTELQPIFENNAYLAAAHLCGDHTEASTSMYTSTTCATSLENHATAHVAKAKVKAASEIMAKQLLNKQDFTRSACHQLLDSVAMHNDKRASHTETSGSLMLGLYSHGGQHGITKATQANRHLSRYLLAYLRHHEMKDSACPVTSLSVGRMFRPPTTGTSTAIGNFARLPVADRNMSPRTQSGVRYKDEAFLASLWTATATMCLPSVRTPGMRRNRSRASDTP